MGLAGLGLQASTHYHRLDKKKRQVLLSHFSTSMEAFNNSRGSNNHDIKAPSVTSSSSNSLSTSAGSTSPAPSSTSSHDKEKLFTFDARLVGDANNFFEQLSARFPSIVVSSVEGSNSIKLDLKDTSLICQSMFSSTADKDGNRLVIEQLLMPIELPHSLQMLARTLSGEPYSEQNSSQQYYFPLAEQTFTQGKVTEMKVFADHLPVLASANEFNSNHQGSADHDGWQEFPAMLPPSKLTQAVGAIQPLVGEQVNDGLAQQVKADQLSNEIV